MIIEIRGAGFGNKGAELMLRSILDHYRRRDASIRFAVSPGIGSFPQRAALGLLQVLPSLHIRVPGSWGRLLMTAGFRRQYGLVDPAEIQVVMDASGFAYGDAWKPEWVERSARELVQAKNHGKKVILLPQAFGPFENPRIRRAVTAMVRVADLVFARDPESCDYVRALVPESGHVRQSPDFTNVLPAKSPEEPPPGANPVAVIPNTKMITAGSGITREAYTEFLARVVRGIRDRKGDPFLLIHGGRNDMDLARRAAAALQSPPPIRYAEDSRRLKGIIAACRFTVGSRFHGLVSALSQGIPSIATGWSHKYRYLLDDYEWQDFLVPVIDPENRLGACLDLLSDPARRDEAMKRLRVRSGELKQETAAMWRRVDALLEIENGNADGDS